MCSEPVKLIHDREWVYSALRFECCATLSAERQFGTSAQHSIGMNSETEVLALESRTLLILSRYSLFIVSRNDI